jgi:hypothetical protein
VAKSGPGIRFNEHMEGDGETVFRHACNRIRIITLRARRATTDDVRYSGLRPSGRSDVLWTEPPGLVAARRRLDVARLRPAQNLVDILYSRREFPQAGGLMSYGVKPRRRDSRVLPRPRRRGDRIELLFAAVCLFNSANARPIAKP